MADTEDTKTKILNTAETLLRKRSFNSFSYKDIADEVGIKKASIHYHFPTKDILGIQVVRRYKQKIDRLIEKLDNYTDDPIEKLHSYFEFFRRGLEKDLICPGLVLSIEFNTLAKEMQEEIINLFDFYTSWLSGILKDGQQQGVFQFEGDPKDEALYIISVVEGAITYARAYHLPDHYNNVVKKIEQNLIHKKES